MEDREAVTPGKKFPRRKVEKYFQKLQKNGTELYVDGEKVSPSQAAAYAVREESPYMADYILGEQGKILALRPASDPPSLRAVGLCGRMGNLR